MLTWHTTSDNLPFTSCSVHLLTLQFVAFNKRYLFLYVLNDWQKMCNVY
jgi:hypothetical protein